MERKYIVTGESWEEEGARGGRKRRAKEEGDETLRRAPEIPQKLRAALLRTICKAVGEDSSP
jgi:hypothetical protein